MTWIWVLIPLTAIVGGLIVEYQKNKMEMMRQNQQNQDELMDLQKEVKSMRTRIENLEAIAATEPESFKSPASKSDTDTSILDDVEFKEENRSSVEEMAQRKRNRS
jgi:hypothetical protein